MQRTRKPSLSEKQRRASVIIDAVQTPVHALQEIVARLEESSIDVGRATKGLRRVADSLSSFAYDVPELAQVLSGANLDSTTKSWLQAEFLSSNGTAGGNPGAKGGPAVEGPPALSSASGASAGAERPGRASEVRADCATLRDSEVSEKFPSVDTCGLKVWDGKPFDVETEAICELVLAMFRDIGAFAELVDEQAADHFVRHVAETYRDPPFHNIQHAFDVTQSVFYFLQVGQARRWLSTLEQLALLVASFAHDAGHDGRSNTFHIAVWSPLAVRYNDQSVLENLHAATLFEIMQIDQCNITSRMTKEDKKKFRNIVVKSILATDMSHHFDLLAKVEQKINPDMHVASAIHSRPFSGSEADVIQFCSLLLHAADISNPAKRWSSSREWSERLAREFFEQGDEERERNLPLSPFMDRHHPNIPLMTLNFIDFVVAPLYSNVLALMPSIYEEIVEHLLANRSNWRDLFESQETQSDEAMQEARRQMPDRTAAFEKTFVLDRVSQFNPEAVASSPSNRLSPLRQVAENAVTIDTVEARKHEKIDTISELRNSPEYTPRIKICGVLKQLPMVSFRRPGHQKLHIREQRQKQEMYSSLLQ